jgi:oligoendopeptidase F
MWRNYKSDKEQAITAYKKALGLGYTRSIPEIYEAADIRFDFSAGYVKDLADFVQDELKKL